MAHHRADGALIGAAFVVIAGVSSALALNPYTNYFAHAPAAGVAVTLDESPVELSGARLAGAAHCLAEVMYYEARGEGVDGEKAVAEVVIARTHNRNYPRSVCDVVYEGRESGRKAGCQFSFVCDGSLDRPREPGAWAHVRFLAEKIMAGQEPIGGETGNAIAYHNIGVNPAWADTMEKTTQIGNHVFYRFVPRERLVQPALTTNLRETQDPEALLNAGAPSEEIQTDVQAPGAVGQGA
jgi:spore germination cell wall hydrolase CwlJ-like protein